MRCDIALLFGAGTIKCNQGTIEMKLHRFKIILCAFPTTNGEGQTVYSSCCCIDDRACYTTGSAAPYSNYVMSGKIRFLAGCLAQLCPEHAVFARQNQRVIFALVGLLDRIVFKSERTLLPGSIYRREKCQ